MACSNMLPDTAVRRHQQLSMLWFMGENRTKTAPPAPVRSCVTVGCSVSACGPRREGPTDVSAVRYMYQSRASKEMLVGSLKRPVETQVSINAAMIPTQESAFDCRDRS